jgi:DNA repair protein RecN (Recombination protein N)
MLESLFIKNFVIVDELEISFEKGFSVLTGETGAGKSILIDALSLCLGQRSDFNSIRKNQDKADITATFNIESNRFAQDWLNEHDLEDGNQLILRRTLSKDGKSKGYINGNPVNINDLKDLSEYLIDIYGQNFHYSLLKPSVQREILDGFGKLQALLSQVKDAYQKWHTLSIDYDNYLKNKEAYEHERVELVEKIKEFKVLDFSNDAWQELQDKQKKWPIARN